MVLIPQSPGESLNVGSLTMTFETLVLLHIGCPRMWPNIYHSLVSIVKNLSVRKLHKTSWRQEGSLLWAKFYDIKVKLILI